MSNHNLGAKCLLLGMLVVVLGTIYSRQGVAAPRTSPHPPGTAQHAARNAGARATLTPEPTEGPRRPSLCERRPQGAPELNECLDRSAEIYLRLAIEPGAAIPPASIATYQLVAYNGGHGDATDVRVSLPLAADLQAPLDAAFSDSGAWVSAVLTGAIELRLGALKRGQSITATLRLRISPDAPLGRDLTTRAQAHWGGSHSSLSNRASLVVAQAASSGAAASLTVNPPSGTSDTAFTVAFDGFASNEHVSLWYQRPDSSNVGLGEVRADRQGAIVFSVPGASLAGGHYRLVAYGQHSQVSAVGLLSIREPQPTPPASEGHR